MKSYREQEINLYGKKEICLSGNSPFAIRGNYRASRRTVRISTERLFNFQFAFAFTTARGDVAATRHIDLHLAVATYGYESAFPGF
jgi:hypothetical protein